LHIKQQSLAFSVDAPTEKQRRRTVRQQRAQRLAHLLFTDIDRWGQKEALENILKPNMRTIALKRGF
jgi:hypothetical protein